MPAEILENQLVKLKELYNETFGLCIKDISELRRRLEEYQITESVKGTIRKKGKCSWQIIIYTEKIRNGKRVRYFESVKGNRQDAERRRLELNKEIHGDGHKSKLTHKQLNDLIFSKEHQIKDLVDKLTLRENSINLLEKSNSRLYKRIDELKNKIEQKENMENIDQISYLMRKAKLR